MKRYERAPARSWIFLALLFVGLAPTAGTLRAQDRDFPVQVENIRVGLQDVYKIGTWTPVWVDLTSRQGRFTGTIDIQVPDEDGKPTHYRTPVAVDAGRGVSTVVGYVRPGTRMAEITVRVVDDQGRRASVPVRPEDLPGGKQPTSLDPSQMVLATLGNPSGVAEVAGLTGFSSAAVLDASGSSTELSVVAPRVPGGMPGRWYGFDAVEAIVVDTNDEAVIEELRDRGDALRVWVRNGGHLIVAGLANWQVVRELLGDMLPAVPAGTTRLNDSGEIEAFAGSSTNQLVPFGSSMLVADLDGLDERGGRALAATTELPLVVRGAHGFGRVTLVGFDVDQPPFSKWEDRSRFWARAIDIRPWATSTDPAQGGGAFFQTRTSDLSSLLYRALDRPPGVALVPFGWVAFFVFVYILLIGPGDYFLLKHVLKRMELTWITFPLIVIVVSALAYIAAYRLKGTELKVVKLDVVDVDSSSGLVRGSSWMTLFSPRNRDYDVTILPAPPVGDTGTAAASADSLIDGLPKAPTGIERLVSWFGPADPRFGGGGGGMSLAGGGYSYGPPGEVDALLGVRIPIWSTKSFESRWTAPMGGSSVVESDLMVVGSDRLDGTITNLSEHTLEEAVLIFGSPTGAVAYDQLGTIAPGASVRVDVASRVRPLSGYLEERARSFLSDDGTLHLTEGEQGVRGIADIGRVAMFRRSMGDRTVVPRATVLGDLDLSGQVTLGRPMLLARIADPLAKLSLNGSADEPRLDQSTLLRVILPLSRSAP